MSVSQRLASALGRNDEAPNIDLAESLVQSRNAEEVRELVGMLMGKDKASRSDAIKVLYEIGERAPHMIAGHLGAFLDLLESKDNRMVWGAMCAVDAIASVDLAGVYKALPRVIAAVDRGSVITRDHAVKAMVKLCSHKPYARRVMPLLHEQLRTCPVNQLPMYAELVTAAVSGEEAIETGDILERRLVGVPQPAKRKRIEKVLKRLRNS